MQGSICRSQRFLTAECSESLWFYPQLLHVQKGSLQSWEGGEVSGSVISQVLSVLKTPRNCPRTWLSVACPMWFFSFTRKFTV